MMRTPVRFLVRTFERSSAARRSAADLFQGPVLKSSHPPSVPILSEGAAGGGMTNARAGSVDPQCDRPGAEAQARVQAAPTPRESPESPPHSVVIET